MSDLSRSTARSECTLDIIKPALEAGLDPNTQWQEFDVNEPHPTGGCVVPSWTPPWQPSWANWNTPLHMTLLHKHIDAAEFLLKNGGDVDLKNALGRTALHEAASRGDHEEAKLLIQYGADVNAASEARKLTDQDCEREGTAGVVPLHEAIRKADLQMVTILIEAKVDRNVTTSDGWTILDLALLERNEEILHFLVNGASQFSEFGALNDGPKKSELKEQAQILLVDNKMFPPVSCRQAYLHVISQPEFRANYDALSKNPSLGTNPLLDTFLSLLAQLAEKTNPENVPGATYCTKCAEFQKSLSIDNSGPFELHQSRESLRTSAREGCCLCAIYEDALINKSGQWARSGSSYDHNKRPQVTLMAFFSTFMGEGSVTVFCEEQRETVELFRLSDSFLLDHQKVTEDKDLGTGSPQASHAARSWIENCRLHHDTCSKDREENPLLPERIIDVGSDAMAPFIRNGNGERGPYVVLSYCRGDSTSYETTSTSLPLRMTDLLHDTLPQTFLDAITATQNLGIQYLWIEKICTLTDETATIQSIFSNATVTISAHSSPTPQEPLFQPRPENTHITPVQFSLRMPKRMIEQHSSVVHRTHYTMLPVSGEKSLYSPGVVEAQASTLQENVLSTRMIHFGPGILYWECLTSHGSEADPEGFTHPYRSSCTNFMNVRTHKRILQGRARKWDRRSGLRSGHGYGGAKDDSDTEDEGEEDGDGLGTIDDLDMKVEAGEDEEKGEDVEDADLEINEDMEIDIPDDDDNDDNDDDDKDDKKVDPKLRVFIEWQSLVTEYTSRTLTDPSSKIPNFLGLSKALEPSLQDTFIAGVWQKDFFLSSLLWSVQKPGATSRNKAYPSWTWASVDGTIVYSPAPAKLIWQPSEMLFDVDVKGPAQGSATGSISLKSTLRKFPRDYKFWRYGGGGLDMFWMYSKRKTMSKERMAMEMTVVSGYRDLRAASEEAKEAGGCEGGKDEVYCVVVGRYGRQPPPRWGYPAYPGGRPKSLVCLCLTPVRGEGEDLKTAPQVFRRVGLCHFWDGPVFWKGAQKDEWVTIV